MTRTMTKQEKLVWKKYRKSARSPYPNTKINQLLIDCQPKSKNHRPHESAKFNIFYDHTEQGHKVITEAWDGPKTRRDVVCLTCDEIYEIENSKMKRGHRHGKDINVFFYDKQQWRK